MGGTRPVGVTLPPAHGDLLRHKGMAVHRKLCVKAQRIVRLLTAQFKRRLYQQKG
jgi:hypothetical protein